MPVRSESPLSEAFSSASRITNLLLSVLALGLSIGLLTSATISLLQGKAIILILLIVSVTAITVFLFIRLLLNELSLRSLEAIVATAIVIDPVSDQVVAPLRLRKSVRDVFDPYPFPILSMYIHKSLKGIEFKGGYDRPHIETLCTLLIALSQKLALKDEFTPTNMYLDRGPFIGNPQSRHFDHKVCGVDEIASSIIDTGILKRAFSYLSIPLPKGITLRVSLSSANHPLLCIESKGVSLTLDDFGWSHGATSNPFWKRQFSPRPYDCFIYGASFRIALSFGGIRLLQMRKRHSAAAWSFETTLGWFTNVYNWIRNYMDWLDSDDEIPNEELFELVEEFPPHYKYFKEVLPPGVGHIVYDMD